MEQRFILMRKKPVLWSTWNSVGIECVNDLLHQSESRFLGHEELIREYGISCSFLDLNQLLSAIPCIWKRLRASTNRSTIEQKSEIRSADGTILDISSSPAKNIYNAILPYKMPLVSSNKNGQMSFRTGMETRA